MPEPVITPLAAFGLSMAILNFFISTIQNLHEKYHDLKDHLDVLADSRRALFISTRRYDLWIRLWGQPTEHAHGALFGTDWQQVKETQLRIKYLARHTANLLCLKIDLPPSSGQETREPDQALNITALAPSDRKYMNRVRSAVKWARRFLPKALGGLNESDDPKDSEEDRRDWAAFTESLSNALTKLPAHGVTDPASDDSETAKKLLQAVLGKARHRMEEVARRVMGILGKTNNLQTNISYLEKAVTHLDELSKMAVQSQGYSIPTGPDEILAISDDEIFRTIARALEGVTQGQNAGTAGNTEWFLGLRLPGDLGGKSTKRAKSAAREISRQGPFSLAVKRDDNKLLTFDITRLLNWKEISAYEASGNYSTDFVSAVRDFRGRRSIAKLGDVLYSLKRTEHAGEYPAFVTNNWKVLLKKCSEETRVRKSLELARARLALGLALWVILLWETDWITHVCSCAFRCVLFPTSRLTSESELHGGDEHKTYREEHIYGSPPGGQDQQLENGTPLGTGLDASISGSDDEGLERLYHIGILLSELILAQPIAASGDPRELCQRHLNVVGHTAGSYKDSDEILRKIGSLQVRSAINFCFTGSRSVWMGGDGTRRVRLDQFIENVVGPLIAYHNIVERHFQSQSAEDFVSCMKEYQDEAYEIFEDAVENLDE